MEVDGSDSRTHWYAKPTVIIVAATKGGTGKSTLAINLAVAAQSSGMKTAIIDTDIEGDSGQGSCLKWTSRRKEKQPFVRVSNLREIESLISLARASGYELLIIDTAGRSTANFKTASALADFILVPSQATILDAEAIEAIIRQAQASRVKTGIVLTQVLHEKLPRTQRYREKYDKMALVLTTIIPRRVDFADAIELGLGVSEHRPNSECDLIIRQLLNEILAILEKPKAER